MTLRATLLVTAFFAAGIAAGTLLLALPAFSFFDYRRIGGLGRSVRGRQVLVFVPLLLVAALLLCLLLLALPLRLVAHVMIAIRIIFDIV